MRSGASRRGTIPASRPCGRRKTWPGSRRSPLGHPLLTLDAPISATTILAEIAEELVRQILAQNAKERDISLLAIAVSHLEKHPIVQFELPLGLDDERRRPGSRQGLARRAADVAVDKIRQRFGCAVVGYGTTTLGVPGAVPNEFRALAEKDL